jgi:hypothetical protein
LMTRETVDSDTFESFATSFIEAIWSTFRKSP